MTEEQKNCVLVTGANGGLGIAIARYFLEHDEDSFVYLGVRSNRQLAQDIVYEFAERTSVLTLDVTKESDWIAAIEHVKSEERIVNVLVNNAGHHDDTLLAMMSQESWTSVIDSNLKSTFLGSQSVLKDMMMRRFGRIVNISSLSGIMAPPGQTNYSAAKAGVIAMTQSLAKEVARMGITVNAVCPGYVDTGALDHMDKEQVKGVKKSIPMRRFGKPEEVAAAVFFLASKDASYITGSCLKIDGGIL